MKPLVTKTFVIDWFQPMYLTLRMYWVLFTCLRQHWIYTNAPITVDALSQGLVFQLKMNDKNLGYSRKNIPNPQNSTYLKYLIEKVEIFIKRMRWKAFFFEKKFKECDDSDSSDDKDEETEKCTYAFKSPRTPPQNIHMNAFESDMYEMIHKVEFNYRPNDFHRKLRSDIRDIRSSNQLLIAADKSNNLHELSTAQYNKLLHDNVTKSYKT